MFNTMFYGLYDMYTRRDEIDKKLDYKRECLLPQRALMDVRNEMYYGYNEHLMFNFWANYDKIYG